MRSTVWAGIDCTMLVAVVLLQAWRLTGVPIHEWLAVALLAGVVAHLLMHWPWVASRTQRILKPRTGRARVNYALNLILFLSFTIAMVSGFAISKVILPMHPEPNEYLKWHGIHEFSSRVMMFTAALHLALNWDKLFARRPRFRFVLRPSLMIAIAVLITTAGVYAYEKGMASPDVVLITPRGRFEHAAPPADIATLRRGTIAPSAKGLAPFVVQSVVVGVVALLGRKLLRLRLD